MRKLVVDTETCGLHGPIVLIQWAELGSDKVNLHEVWRSSIDDTIALIDDIAENCIIGFNLAFDWFHLCQMYTTLLEYKERFPTWPEEVPPDYELYAQCEMAARDRGCLKPLSACDIMLVAQQTHYQSLMDRKDIYIRRVPTQIADQVAAELNKRLPFKPIYFDRRKTKGLPVWQVKQSKKEGFKDIYVAFRPSSRLKALVKDAFNMKSDPLLISDLGLPANKLPLELGYAPFALALQKLPEWKGKRKAAFVDKWKGAWPEVIDDHVIHWGFNKLARRYAADDVKYTMQLYQYFGEPEPGDDDSILACMVGAVRWHGFNVDLKKIVKLREIAVDTMKKTPIAADPCRRWLAEVMDPIQAATLESTDREALEELKKETDPDECAWCEGEGCAMCPPHPVAERAQAILDARHAKKEIELYDKMLIAGRLHASLRVIGTLSSRMAGADGLNVHGIKRTKTVRECFPLAFDGYDLNGGDFDAFEICIADAYYDDPTLRAELQSEVDCVFCSGTGVANDPKHADDNGVCKQCDGTGKEPKKIHAIFGTHIFPGWTYERIRLTEKTDDDKYTTSKSGVFTWLFAGTEYSFQKRLGIPSKQAAAGLASFNAAFPKVGEKRGQAMIDFQPMHQPKGRRTEILWRDHKTSVSTMLGFERRFDLEFQVVRGLYDLAQDPPPEWRTNDSCVRFEDAQTVGGAAQSALYGAAFSLQGRIARAAINTPIQGTGAQITKRLQRNIFDLQPVGYNEWRVLPLNVHDEIMVVTKPEFTLQVTGVAVATVNELKSIVPLLSITWKEKMKSWAEK